MNERLLRYLLEHRLLTEEQAGQLRQAQAETGHSVRELILERGLLPEERLVEALSAVTNIPLVRLYEKQIPMDVRQTVKPDLLRTHAMMPFAFDPEDGGTLQVAMNDPMNMRGLSLIHI